MERAEAKDIALGDVVAIRGQGIISALISASSGMISHVGIVTAIGDDYEAVQVTQALDCVKTLSLAETLSHAKFGYCLHSDAIVDLDRAKLVCYALSRLGQTYPYANILWQFMKQVTGNPKWTEYADSDTKEICSELVADSYLQIGLDFGISPRDATPSDLMGYALDHHPPWWVWPL